MKKLIVFLIFLIQPLNIKAASTVVVSNLNFGTIVAHPFGETIKIDASAGSAVPIAISGGSSITYGGSSAHLRFIPDMAGQNVRIFYPVSISLTSGGNNMTINQFSSNSTNTFITTSTSPVDFYIGGVLQISSGQSGGNYSGTMNVIINVTNP